MDALAMLQELLEQDQFELVFREKQEKADKDIRLVYLMNDAVESFLVFKNARMTGEYRKDYEGELEASISHNGKEYILIVRQGNSVVTLFFDDIFPEVHLYDYGEIGHFWVQGYEYLRQLEYRIAILRILHAQGARISCIVGIPAVELLLLSGGSESIYCTERRWMETILRGNLGDGRVGRRCE